MDTPWKKIESLRGAVPLSHFFLKQRVLPGDLVVDATCGNGQDTLLLARLAGPSGRVWAFDLQPRAVAVAKKLLEEHGVLATVTLLEVGHERIAEFVLPGLKAVVFNLGYLPGADVSLVTAPETTLKALKQSAELLVPGGIISICIYTGHPGGDEEADAVREWCMALPPKEYNAWCSRQLNRPEFAPYFVFVERIR